MREASAEPEFCIHMETVLMAAADAGVILKRRREALRAAIKARKPAREGPPPRVQAMSQGELTRSFERRDN